MGQTILIVEDNPVNMELETDLLEVAGYRVLQAATADIGLRLAREEKPDLILMDVSLPGTDGLTALKLLRADSRTQAIPVVIVTAHAMKGDEERAQQAGAAGYITKPIQTRAFARQVAGFLAARDAGSAPQIPDSGPPSRLEIL